MTKQITGIFDNGELANRAVDNLLNEGFAESEISLIMSEQTRDRLFSSTSDEANRVAKGTVAGAAIGGALGVVIAGLTAAGALVTNGGSLLVSGPIVAMLSGAGAGAVAGGLAGALIRAGFAADEANHYAKELEKGKAIIVVHTQNMAKQAFARTLFKVSGAMVEAA